MSCSYRRMLFASLATYLLFSVAVVYGETVTLAECPKEPEVEGEYYNDGTKCVRDRQVRSRTFQEAECPEGYYYKTNWCRKRFHTKMKPVCPTGFQFFGGKDKGECHSPCPPGFASNYGECVMQRQTLTSKFMTCADDGHRYDAFCCSPELGNCPQIECNVEQAPGKFYYQNGVCQRQAQSIARKTSPQFKLRLGQDAQPQQRQCADGLIPIRNVCQEPCPEGFRASKGCCHLFSCTFDTQVDTEVRCPEGVYKVPQSLV